MRLLLLNGDVFFSFFDKMQLISSTASRLTYSRRSGSGAMWYFCFLVQTVCTSVKYRTCTDLNVVYICLITLFQELLHVFCCCSQKVFAHHFRLVFSRVFYDLLLTTVCSLCCVWASESCHVVWCGTCGSLCDES